jgi:actin-related protein
VHEGLAQSIGSFKDAPDLQLTHSHLHVMRGKLTCVRSINVATTHDTNRERLCGNIVITGGSAQISGLVPRLHSELAPLLPPGSLPANDERHDSPALLLMLMDLAWRDTELGGKVKIVANGEGVDGAWLGGSMVSSCERLQEALITQELYDEHGPYPLCFFISVFCSRTHLHSQIIVMGGGCC